MTTKTTQSSLRREWPTNLRETGLMEILCPHGIGHPSKPLTNPKWWHDHFGVHGCDGCCSQAVFFLAEMAHQNLDIERERKPHGKDPKVRP